MKVGDLVRASWESQLAPPEFARESHIGLYMGVMSDGRFKGGYHNIFMGGEFVSLPEWHWKVEVISESV